MMADAAFRCFKTTSLETSLMHLMITGPGKKTELKNIANKIFLSSTANFILDTRYKVGRVQSK